MWQKYLVNALKFLVFLGVGLGILYLLYTNQNAAYQEYCAQEGIAAEDCSLLQKVIEDFRQANYWWILAVLTAFTISNVSRAIRWKMLIKPLGYQPKLINAFLTTCLGYFANLGLPRIGEVVRGGTLARYENIRIEKVMGTIVVDRVVDVLSIIILTSVAFLIEFDTLWAFAQTYVSFGSLVILGIAGALFLGLLFALRKPILATSFGQKILELAKGFWQGIQTISKLENPALFILHSVNIWFMYFLMTYLCFFAFAPTAHLSPLAGLVVFVFGAWGIVIPSPGGMGTYHFLAQTALTMYGVSGSDGFSWANIAFFSIQLGCNVSIGILALILLPIINRNYNPQPIHGVSDETATA
ncbi:MAG: lysylphosphatidylglycerol synthase transmembrane domain-containing protein [Bacteroidota bacterium]